ncbi:MAG: DMT family transporter [Clostridia bacterium]|nr:DMT family transporter [Clostridia bacterium]
MALAYIFTFLKNAIYGTTNFFTKGLNSNNIDAIDILALRFLLSFVILWLLKTTKILKINVCIKDIFKKTEKHKYIKPLFLAALFSPVIEMLFETMGFTMTTAITAGVITSLMPVASCIFESIILKESTTLSQKIFLALGIIGVIYIAINTNTSSGNDTVIGILCLIVAVIAGPAYLVFSRKSSGQFAALEITYFSCLLGAVVFNALSIIKHLWQNDILHYFDPYFDPKNIMGWITLSIVSTIFCTLMNNFSMSRLQASTVAAFGGVSTIVTILIGVLFLEEKLYYFHYIGFTLILIRMIGVSWVAIKKDKKSSAK